MHVGLYAPVWPPGQEANGIVTYVRIVRDELLRQGHRVSVFCGVATGATGPDVHPVRAPRRSRVWLVGRRLLGLSPASIYDYGRSIADTVARVHAVDPLDVFEMEESFGWCEAVARQLPVPLVVKLHGPAFLSLVDEAMTAADRSQRVRVEGQALHRASWVVAPSASTLHDTAALYGLDGARMQTVPNPVDSVDPSLVWRADTCEPGHLLFVGRFDRRKGGDLMLQVFARLAAERPGLRLSVVGPDVGIVAADGSRLRFAEALAAAMAPDLAARVHFLGNQPAAEIRQLRQRCNVAVIATRWESFGYVVAESMAQGCPIAAFDVAGVNELLVDGHSGLLAPLDDVDGLAARIARLLDAPADAARMGAAARAAVASQCGADVVAGQLLALYRRVSAPAQDLAEAS